MASDARTGLVWHERYMWHDTGHGGGVLPAAGWVEPGLHIENPEPKRRLKNLLDASGLSERLVSVAARSATDAEILRFHTAEYLERVEQLSATGGGDASLGAIGDETPFGPGGFAVARLAAGGVLAAVDAVLTSTVSNAYALTRPPGHHAVANAGKGFCLLANAVLGVLHSRAAHGLIRAAVVDWDVHHGNGTEGAFLADPDVLTVSLHQEDCYPAGSGRLEVTGTGDARGTNINVPLPAGSGVGAYAAAMEQVVLPALRRFAPELIIVACGFDASAADPLARMMLHSDGFRAMTEALLAVAGECAGGRIVMCHEGGYSPYYVPFCGLAVLEALSGQRTGVQDPYLASFARWPGQAAQPHQLAAIEAVLDAHPNLR